MWLNSSGKKVESDLSDNLKLPEMSCPSQSILDYYDTMLNWMKEHKTGVLVTFVESAEIGQNQNLSLIFF